jgi:hypothetical protein
MMLGTQGFPTHYNTCIADIYSMRDACNGWTLADFTIGICCQVKNKKRHKNHSVANIEGTEFL